MKTKILKTTGIVLLVIIAFIWTAPLLFKSKITNIVRARITRDIRAHVYFSGASISLFRHFPDISIGLDQLQITCVGEFQDDTLMRAGQLDIACDWKSLISGDSIRVHSIHLNEPYFHFVTNRDGHHNWDIFRSGPDPLDYADSSARSFQMNLQRYEVHHAFVDYQDQKKNIHVVMNDLEQEGSGNFSADTFSLHTKTTAASVDFDFAGKIPYQVKAKTNIQILFHVDNKAHRFSFNTDQISFNDLQLHAEGFFEWINDSSYNMSIRYKAPSTKFKNLLSMMPSVYQKDFAGLESSGQVNLNGFIKGRYDENHRPAYHTNLFVQNGYLKYAGLPYPVENMRFGFQLDNPDGMADHLTVNIPEAHAEINHDSLDLRMLVKNLNTKPFIDFAMAGKMDLSNISRSVRIPSGMRLAGFLNAHVHAKGDIPGGVFNKKDLFEATGNFDLENFSFASESDPAGIVLDHLLLEFSPKNIAIKDLKGMWHNTHMNATGSLNNLFDFAINNRPLAGTMDIHAEELNLRDWVNVRHPGSATAGTPSVFVVPDMINLNIQAEATQFHFDNLDLQNLSAHLVLSEQTVHLLEVKANGLDGEIHLNGTYTTLENKENPDFALDYDVKGVDVQKTFFAFNTIRRIMPVAKFISGNIDAQMSLSGSLNNDMTTDLRTLYGEGHVELLTGVMREFGPMDKLSQSLEIVSLKDVPMKNVKAAFSFREGKVAVSPFLVKTNDIEMEIGGNHGFDQSVDYGISLKVPRSQLGSKGNLFVKDVVERAAVKGIPVRLKDAVSMNVQICGSINSPDVKEDMDAVVDHATTDLKKEIDDFVNSKLDSAKQMLLHPPTESKKPVYIHTASHSPARAGTKKRSGSVHKHPGRKKHSPKHYALRVWRCEGVEV